MFSDGQNALKRLWDKGFVYFSVLPSLALLFMFRYYPAFVAFRRSLYDWSGGSEAKFVGFGNFVEMFSDEVFRYSLRNVLILAAAEALISLVFPLLAAELTFSLKSLKAQYVYRTLFVLPLIIPITVTLLLWGFIYRPDGLLNALLQSLSLEHWCRAWLGDFKTALYAIIFIGFPWIGGRGTFSYLIYLAGLQAIPQEVFEAGAIDGATGLRRILSIDLPLLLGQIKLILVLAIIVIMQSYYIQLILTGGGPGYATMVPGLYMYTQTFTYFRLGYGCAVGVFLFAIIFTLSFFTRRYIRSDVD